MYRIMAVDDEAVITMQLKKRLTKMGYNVVGTASSGINAIEMARRLRPDLVLMDIVMPGDIDGIEAARVIKQEMDIPVVFLTAYANSKTIDKAKDVEPYGYIVKPFQEKEIKAIVEISIHKKCIERLLLELGDLHKGTIEHANDGIAIAQDGEIKFTNPKFAELLEYTKEELDGKAFFEILTSPSALFALELHKKRMMGEEVPNIYHAELLTKKGKKIPIEANCSVTKFEGKPAELIYIRDIRERRNIDPLLSLSLSERGNLTSRQRTIIQIALVKGFYDYPKKIHLKELASELDLSPSTLNEILHRGGKHIFNQYFGVE